MSIPTVANVEVGLTCAVFGRILSGGCSLADEPGAESVFTHLGYLAEEISFARENGNTIDINLHPAPVMVRQFSTDGNAVINMNLVEINGSNSRNRAIAQSLNPNIFAGTTSDARPIGANLPPLVMELKIVTITEDSDTSDLTDIDYCIATQIYKAVVAKDTYTESHMPEPENQLHTVPIKFTAQADPDNSNYQGAEAEMGTSPCDITATAESATGPFADLTIA